MSWNTMKSTLIKLYRDERGAEGLEKLLIIAAIVLPLLAVLLFFGDEIVEWLTDRWNDLQGQSDDIGDNPF